MKIAEQYGGPENVPLDKEHAFKVLN